MDQNQTIFELIHKMEQITNNMIIQWNQMFHENLGISHILVLSHLHKNGRSRPSDIAKGLGLTPPTLTHLSEKLIKKGLVVRERNEVDRRALYLKITDDGCDILSSAQEKGLQLRMQLFEKLDIEELHQLLNIYSKLNG